MKSKETLQRTLNILQLIALIYTIVVIPTFYLTLMRYSAVYGVPFTDISLTLGLGFSPVVAFAILIAFLISMIISIPAFGVLSTAHQSNKSQWLIYLNYRYWTRPSNIRVQWQDLVRSTVPGVIFFQIFILYFVFSRQSVTDITAVQTCIILALVLLMLAPDKSEGTARIFSNNKKIIKILEYIRSLIKGWFSGINILVFSWSFFMFVFLYRLLDICRVCDKILAQQVNDVQSFFLFQTAFFLLLLFLLIGPKVSGRRYAALVFVAMLSCLFIFVWPGMSHLINQVFISRRIGGGIEMRLQVRSEVGCRLPLPADLARPCHEEFGRPGHIAVSAWLLFQGQERLYIRLRPLEQNDRRAQFVLNRASVDVIEYTEEGDPALNVPTSPPAHVPQRGPS